MVDETGENRIWSKKGADGKPKLEGMKLIHVSLLSRRGVDISVLPIARAYVEWMSFAVKPRHFITYCIRVPHA